MAIFQCGQAMSNPKALREATKQANDVLSEKTLVVEDAPPVSMTGTTIEIELTVYVGLHLILDSCI